MESRKAEEDNRLRTNPQGPQKIAGSEEERVLRSDHGKLNKRRRMKKKEGCRLKDKGHSLLHSQSTRRKKEKEEEGRLQG
jgi:hypothetical protein